MAADSAEHEAVLIVNFALNDASAKDPIVDSGRNQRTPGRWWLVASCRERKWREDLAVAENVERFVSEDFEGLAEQDEADIGVFCASAGSSFEGHEEAGFEQVVGRRICLEETRVSGESRTVSEQVAEGNVAALGMPFRTDLSANSEGGQQVADELIEVKLSALLRAAWQLRWSRRL